MIALRSFSRLFFLLSFGLITYQVQAQNSSVQATLAVNAPYSNQLSDYVTEFNKRITLVLTGNADVRLTGSLKSNTGVWITVPEPLSYYRTNNIDIQPIQVRGQKRITAADLGRLFSRDPSRNTSSVNLQHGVFGSNFILPEGDYELCVKVFEGNGERQLSDQVCTYFTIQNIEPPYLTAPVDKDTLVTPTAAYQPVQFQWTFPAGAQPNRIEYVLQIAELRAGQNPYNVFESGPPFAEIVLPNANPVYFLKASDPRLEIGQQYAWRVQVRGKGQYEGLTNFQNKGFSTVNTFTYGSVKTTAADLVTSSEKVVGSEKKKDEKPPVNTIGGNCSCKFPAPTDKTPISGLTNNKTIYIGSKEGYQLSISELSANGDKYTGKGTVAFSPTLTPAGRSGLFLPLRVSFDNIQVNKDGILLAGQIQSIQSADGIGFRPNVASTPDMGDLANDMLRIANPLTGTWTKIKNKISSEASTLFNQQRNGAGIETPLGYGSDVFTMAIDNVVFTPTSAQYDAMTVIEAFGGADKISIPLGIKGACLPSVNCQGSNVLYLLKDTPIPYLGITLKGGTDAQNITYFSYTPNAQNGSAATSELNIVAEYKIPKATYVADNGPVMATLRAKTTKGFDNWTAKASIANEFKLDGIDEFAFKLNSATFDHDNDTNPDGFETMLTGLEKDGVDNGKLTNLRSKTWHGFFMENLSVTLPGVFQTKNGAKTTMPVKNMVIDGHLGLSGSLSTEKVINYGDGSLDGWYFSLDNIDVTFFDGVFIKASAAGKIGLPITDGKEQSALAYTNTISPNGSTGKLEYLFNIKPTGDLNIAIWKAGMTIKESSVISVSVASGDVVAKADINGNITFKPEIGGLLSDVKLDLMDIEHLVVQSKAPYLSMGESKSKAYQDGKAMYQQATDFVGKFASPQHSVGGSPITVDAFTPVTRSNGGITKAGFYFHGSLDLADMPLSTKAGVGLAILAKVETKAGRPVFSYDRTELEDVQVGGQLGPVKVDGSVKFFRDDQKMGNGFRGTLGTTLGGTSIKGQAMFGRKDFAYWYFYLAGASKTGLFNIGPVTVNGIGGGLYHNMTPPKPDPNQFEETAKAEGNYAYSPAKGTDGLKAALYFSVASQFVLNARATIEGTMNNGSLELIRVNGLGHLISDGDQKGMLDATVDAQYHFPEQLFTLDAAVKGSLPMLSMTGQLNALADFKNKKYYVKVGEPTRRNALAVKGLGDVAKAAGYFMVGNSDIPDIPPPPDDVISPETMSKFVQAGYKGFGLKPAGMPSGFEQAAGMAFGATLRVGVPDIEFLIFWAKLRAGAGFDVNIRQLPGAVCEETGGEIGYNGWYASGQAYFEFMGGVGVHAFLGDVKIVELKAAALLGAGLPNPTWFQGFLTGEGTFLGASLGFTLPVKVGERCTIKTNPFEQRIIADVTPKDGDSNVDIMTNPEILLNYPRQFDVTYQDRNDNWLTHSYDLRPSVTLNGTKQPTDQFYFPNEKSIVWNVPSAFDAPLKKQTVTFAIDVYEDGKVFIDPDPKGAKKPVRDELTTRFTTGECRAALKANDVAYTFPFNDQKYYLQNENSKGAIMLRKQISCLTSAPSFEYYVLFKPTSLGTGLGANLSATKTANVNTNSQATLSKTVSANQSPLASKADQNVLTGSDVLTVEARVEGNLVSFEMPRLANKTRYAVQLIKQPKQSALAGVRNLKQANLSNLYVNWAEALAQVSTQKMVDQDVSNKLNVLNRQGALSVSRNPTTQQLELQPQPFVLYDFAFSTSQFSTLTQKMNTVAATTIAFVEGDNTIRLSFAGQEGFDEFDLNGFDTGMPINGTSRTTFIDPLIRVNENGNSWIDNVLSRDIQPKWRYVADELRKAGVLMTETPRGNQTYDRYYDVAVNQSNGVGYGEAHSRNLNYVVTRLSETIDDRILTMKENNQLLFARATTFAQELNQQYRDRDKGCGFGTYRCPSDSYNNIRGELEKKYASWGGKMVGLIGENREQYGQDLRRRVMDLMNWDARQSLCRSVPITPTLTFSYRDVWEAGKSQPIQKRYTINRCK